MRRFVHDLWAPLNHRAETMGDGTARPQNVPMWVPDMDARRMAAYRLLASYIDNCTRYYMPEKMWERPTQIIQQDAGRLGTQSVELATGKSPAEKLREYGDARLLVEQAAALVLGESQEVVIPDAADVPDDAPDPEKTAQARAVQFDEWLHEWAEVERLLLRLYEQEDDSQGLGDGVLVLGWDVEAGRPRLRKYDVESYFPVLTGDQDADEFPNRVHFAWVECLPDDTEILHRLTYWRRQLPGNETRRYKYSDKPSRWAVYQTHATWELSKIRDDATGLYDLSLRTAKFVVGSDGAEINDLDIGVDYMPIIHVPNTPSGGQHFGRSILLCVAQLLDDIGFADSDLAAASEAVGNTPVVVTGGAGQPGGLATGPGAQWNLPAGGDAKLLDTSGVLTGQINYVNHLLSRLSVNTRLADALLGRIQPNEVPSGYALGLGFAPTRSLISKMRLVRAEKHPLILKFAMRFAQQFGLLPEGPTPRAEIALGAYLPEDVQATIDRVAKLLEAKAISRRTGVQMLVNVGLPIDDAEDEVRRIEAKLFADALALFEATGDESYVLEFLGLEENENKPPQPTPPAPPGPEPPAPPAPAPPAPPAE